MDPIGEMTWKNYYALEREKRVNEIRDHLIQTWNDPDPEVVAVLERNGALSIPHTFLDTSMDPLIRTVRAIYRSGKKKVLAVGLLHFVELPESEEFCLDGLKYVLDLAAETFDLPKVGFEVFYLERDTSIDWTDIEAIVKDVEHVGRALKDKIDPDTALVMTGDLVHYGHGYRMKDVLDDPTEDIKEFVTQSMNHLYRDRNPSAYIEHARKFYNDQLYLAVGMNAALGGNLGWKVFSTDLSDYSDILEAKRPTVVASVFYGVTPR